MDITAINFSSWFGAQKFQRYLQLCPLQCALHSESRYQSLSKHDSNGFWRIVYVSAFVSVEREAEAGPPSGAKRAELCFG